MFLKDYNTAGLHQCEIARRKFSIEKRPVGNLELGRRLAALLERSSVMRRLTGIVFASSLALSAMALVLIKVEGSRQYKSVDLKSICDFPLDAQNGAISDIPAWVRGLDGKKVRMNGFMYAHGTIGAPINSFQFVNNIGGGLGPPRIQERLFARLSPGKTAKLSTEMQCICGILHININRSAGAIQSVFVLDVDDVQAWPSRQRGLSDLLGPLLAAGVAGIATALLMAVRVIELRKRLPPPQRFCRRCGYDLRATPARCPECGTTTARAAGKAIGAANAPATSVASLLK